MRRATLNFFIDLATCLVMLAMICTGVLLRFVLPPGSGERRSVWDLTRHEWGDVHFWLAVTMGGLVLVHLVLHWDWICSVVVRWLRKPGAAPQPSSPWRRNLAGVGMAAVTVLLVGGFLWAAQTSVVEREGGGRQLRSGRGGGEEVRPEGMKRDEGARGGGGRQLRGGRGAQRDSSSPDLGPEGAIETAVEAELVKRPISANYVHRTMRCATCLSIEKQSREAIELAHGGELSAGRLEWQALNIEEPGNEHFEKDFELQSASLVLVEMPASGSHGGNCCPKCGSWLRTRTRSRNTLWRKSPCSWAAADSRSVRACAGAGDARFVRVLEKRPGDVLRDVGRWHAGGLDDLPRPQDENTTPAGSTVSPAVASPLPSPATPTAPKGERCPEPPPTAKAGDAPASDPVAAKKLPRVVDLGADKCKACKDLAPILEQLRMEYEGRVTVEFIDVWKNPQAGEPYQIRVIPTQVFFDADGKEVWRHVGFLPKADFVAKFAELGVK